MFYRHPRPAPQRAGRSRHIKNVSDTGNGRSGRFDIEEIRRRNPCHLVVKRHLKLTRKGRLWSAKCPFHDDSSASFFVYDDRDGGHFHCFGCGAHGDSIDFVQRRKGLDFLGAASLLAGEAGLEAPEQEDRPKPPSGEAEKPSDPWRARRIAFEARPIAGTIGERYLAERGIPGPYPKELRFHQAVWRSETSREEPALIVVAIEGGQVRRVQTIFIDPNTCRKAGGQHPKLTHGTGAGHVPAEFAGCNAGPTIVSEGPEDAVSIWATTHNRTLATLGAYNLPKLRAQDVGTEAILAWDNDETGRKYIAQAALKLQSAGVLVRVCYPPPGIKDFNELLRQHGPNAVRHAITTARPWHPLGYLPPDAARAQLATTIRSYIARISAWHREPEETRGDPEHGGIKASTGLGKSQRLREEVAAFVHPQRADGLPDKGLFAVPEHRLAAEAAEAFSGSGLDVQILYGRAQRDPDDPTKTLCQNLQAVQDAIDCGDEPQQAVCGSLKPGAPACQFRPICAYQRRRAAIIEADVIIAANNILFDGLPDAVRDKVGLIVIDEAFWTKGLAHPANVRLNGYSVELQRYPVADEAERDWLLDLTKRLTAAITALPARTPIPRSSLESVQITAADCHRAYKLEMSRIPAPVMQPGMSDEERRSAKAADMVRIAIRRRARVWRELADMLDSPHNAAGRVLRVTIPSPAGLTDGLELNGIRRISAGIARKPVLVLDATLPLPIVTAFLPRLSLLAEINAAETHTTIRCITGGFGKTSLVPARIRPDVPVHVTYEQRLENERRDGKVQRIRDYILLHGTGNDLVVCNKDIRHHFEGMNSVRVAHFNALSGLDQYKDVGAIFIIGRPMPRDNEAAQLTRAIFGRPVAILPSKQVECRQPMADGSTTAVEVRRFDDPDTDAVRAAIVDSEVIQSAGRGRGVNRTRENPLAIHIFGDVLLPMPVNEIVPWSDMVPGPIERMAARGLLTLSPTDTVRLYPDLFASDPQNDHEPPKEAVARASDAARQAFLRAGVSRTSPYRKDSYREKYGKCPAPPPSLPSHVAKAVPVRIRYMPAGCGQQERGHAWCADPDETRARLEDIYGELTLFKVIEDAPTETAQPEQHAEALESEPHSGWPEVSVPPFGVSAVVSAFASLQVDAVIIRAMPPPRPPPWVTIGVQPHA